MIKQELVYISIAKKSSGDFFSERDISGENIDKSFTFAIIYLISKKIRLGKRWRCGLFYAEKPAS